MEETKIPHKKLYDGDTFTVNGLNFKVEFPYDEDSGAPWENEDGHGPVSDWVSRDKMPGERVLSGERHGRKRYYDFAAAVELAKKDGWDTPPYKTGTAGEIAARAADADYKRMKAWANDEWHYVGVVVTLMNTEDEPTHEIESLWGTEDDDAQYLTDTAYELAEELANRIGDATEVVKPGTTYQIR